MRHPELIHGYADANLKLMLVQSALTLYTSYPELYYVDPSESNSPASLSNSLSKPRKLLNLEKYKTLEKESKHAQTLYRSSGKKPLLLDWVNSAHPMDELKTLNFEFLPDEKFNSLNARLAENETGWVLEENHLVLDIDPRGFAPNRDSLSLLSEHLKIDLLKTAKIKIRTGGGGYHLYYTLPKGKRRAFKNHRDFPGIDFLSHGNYVVTAGSLHVSGMDYCYMEGSLSVSSLEEAEAPKELVDFVSREAVSKEPTSKEKVAIEADTSHNIAKVEAILHEFPPAIEGQSGNATTFRAACVGRDHGLSLSKTLELLSEIYNPRCEPPWEQEELTTLVKNAYRYAKEAQGGRTPEAVFGDGLLANASANLNSSPDLKTPSTGTLTDTLTDTELMPQWQDGFMRTQNGGVKQGNLHNLLLIIRNTPQLQELVAYNQFSGRVHFTRPAPWHLSRMDEFEVSAFPKDGLQWVDGDEAEMKAFVMAACGYEASTNIIQEAVVCEARRHGYHPVRNYLKSLEWDNTPRLDTWLSTYCGAEDTVFTRAVAAKTLIAAVKRIFVPGCKFDDMLVLEGAEGARKSTAVAVLAGRWFSDGLVVDLASRDAVDNMQGKWIIELAEMESTTRADTNFLKGFLSRGTDRARFAFARHTQDYPRQSIFIGTTNESEYLKSENGNRRFWPVEVSNINIEKLIEDRDQLWAEAYARFKKGEVLYLTDQASKDEAKQRQAERLITDEWAHEIQDWLSKSPEVQEQKKTTGTKIWTDCLMKPIGSFDRVSQRRIASVMIQIGWKRCTIRENGRIVKGYRDARTKLSGTLDI